MRGRWRSDRSNGFDEVIPENPDCAAQAQGRQPAGFDPSVHCAPGERQEGGDFIGPEGLFKGQVNKRTGAFH